MRALRAIGLSLVVATLAPALEVRADAGAMPTALLPRRGLTAGGYDHFQGQLAPNGEEIYFAGNANSTIEIFVQNLSRGFPRPLFDDAADVAQPRVSPDGRRLAFISYQQDAGGDACVVNIDGGGRRCLTEVGVAALHIFWFPDGRHLGVLTRRSLDATHELRRFAIDRGRGEGERIVERNMSAPAISPDGRWLAYVPLERPEGDEARAGLRRASAGLVLHPLDGGDPFEFVPDLPGASSFPAFAVDGDHLYFTQFLNDTNFDGAIDGDDNGVLFRAPFDTQATQPARAESYQQLTSGRTNCQYPAPARDRLIATCVRAGVLQIYSMPLGGLIPPDYGPERIEEEIAASRDVSEQLLLLRRLIANERDRDARVALYRRVIARHLGLREYESVDYYLRLLRRVGGDDPALREWITVQREIVGHRREEQRLGHGNLTGLFIEAQRERLERLSELLESERPTTRRLARLAEAEIFLVLGDKAAALEMFEAVEIDGERDASVVQAWMRLAEALLRDLGEEDRWLDVHRRLSSHPALEARDRLYHASAFVRALARGRGAREELPLLRAARRDIPADSELALMIDVEVALLQVSTRGEEEVEAELLRLWRAAPTFERHRAVAMITIDRASRRDYGRLLATFGRRWLDDVPEDHAERKYAEALYAEVMLERAYVEQRHGRSARALFREITELTPSLEAHVGYIEASLNEVVTREELLREYRERYDRADPVEAFAEAYLVGRALLEIGDPALHAAEIERARALLRPAAEALPRSVEIHHLYAYLAHRHFHRTGDHDAARAAHRRYYLALDLAPNDPRRRANLLVEIGLLQASLGNHRIALRHFTERDRLPFIDPPSELAFRLAQARSLFHAASYERARAEIDRAIALVDREPTLTRFRAVAVDRAALYHYASGDHEGAADLYQSLIEVTEGEALAVRMKARMGLGAAALAHGELEFASRALEEARELLEDETEPFRRDARLHDGASHFDRDDYRPLIYGFVARVRRERGDLPGSVEALRARLAFYEARFERVDRDDDLLEMSRIHHQLAESAYRQGEGARAAEEVTAGLAHADRWVTRTNTEIEEAPLALVRAAAELRIYGDVSEDAFGFDVNARVAEAYRIITARPNPRWAHERFLFPIYLALLETPRARGPQPPPEDLPPDA